MLVDALPPLRSNQHLRPRDQQAAHKKQSDSRPLPQTLSLRRLRVWLYCIWQWQYLGSQHTIKQHDYHQNNNYNLTPALGSILELL